MYLQRLSLIDFKNVGEAQIELSPQINCMVGDNGTGKTNLLDAVHYLSMCKSAFGLSDTQCVRHGSEAFLVDGRYGEPATDRTERIVCSFKKGGQKKLCRNGKEYEKLSDHIGLIPLVLVTPSDTALINESGEERRKYLNSFISQLDREYLSRARSAANTSTASSPSSTANISRRWCGTTGCWPSATSCSNGSSRPDSRS